MVISGGVQNRLHQCFHCRWRDPDSRKHSNTVSFAHMACLDIFAIAVGSVVMERHSIRMRGNWPMYAMLERDEVYISRGKPVYQYSFHPHKKRILVAIYVSMLWTIVSSLHPPCPVRKAFPTQFRLRFLGNLHILHCLHYGLCKWKLLCVKVPLELLKDLRS